ncbi:hypothetical protein HMPREF6123_0664 [Oribacterium sinus F0268]|uniref:Uncharacterized protein n=1 Tax=Oribacterium sinus F0268 TaxID=585501 RepID=C2KVZ5_9FIRM|nr:hypothetical protein HMPREF6123_0664 [Oribacterium sinus F0268]
MILTVLRFAIFLKYQAQTPPHPDLYCRKILYFVFTVHSFFCILGNFYNNNYL